MSIQDTVTKHTDLGETPEMYRSIEETDHMDTCDKKPILSVQKDQSSHGAHGLTVLTCAVFIVGEIAGSGVLALPSAVEGAGWVGLILMVVCCLISSYTGHVLGQAWCLVRDRYEEYQGQVRNPYPAIGEVAYGKPGRYLVSFSINFTLFGVGVVFLLIASENVQTLLQGVKVDISFCYWLIIMAGVLTPLAWLGTPKDFWPIAVGATGATAIACVILFANIMVDIPKHPVVHHKAPNFISFFTAFGTICFGFGGHPAFPTFQADMRDQRKFGKAVFIGYLTVLAMYLPVSAAGFFIYGDMLKSNILGSVSPGGMNTAVTIIITLHLVCAFIIVINPFCQELEEILRIPKAFNIKRCIIRTCVVALVLFVAESVPHFGAILSLVGGSTTTLLAYICPSLFYLKLCRMDGPWEKVIVPTHVKVANYEIVLVGVIAGAASTYSAIAGLAQPGAFTVPCYVNVTAALGK